MLQQKELWAQALQAAFDEHLVKKSGGGVAVAPAAPLKPLLVRHAAQLGLAFPPDGYEKLKFVDFLDLLPDVVKTLRRPGQDALVAKVEEAHLLTQLSQDEGGQASAKRPRVALRQDVFRAFTQIPAAGQRRWYSRDSDEFLDAADAIQGNLLAVPAPTFEEAVRDRQDFANALPDTVQRDQLLATLDQAAAPLGAFGDAVKSLRLERRWHIFRFDRLLERVKGWANSVGLPWNSAWEGAPLPVQQAVDAVTARETNAFLAGLMQLGPDDAKRVMVPLDIVLRLLRRD
jgi:hypothetical protein